MPTGGTITAPSTAPGSSSRAMIRVSGSDVRRCAMTLMGLTLDARGVHHARCKLLDGRTLAMIVLWYPGPNSYTGEDTIELVMPGNPVLIEKVIDALLAVQGVSYAQPGEFSARSYLNGRLTLQEAEGIALRIAADHEETLQAASSLLDGSYGRSCSAWVEEIATLLALVESGVDFSDQDDVIPITPDALDARLDVIENDIHAQIGSDAGDRVQTDHPQVVFMGRPNAGKSSLFNVLLGRRRATVSDQAGTTRDAIQEEIDLGVDVPGAGIIELVDLAGLGEQAIDDIDRDAQVRARKAIESAAVVLWCDPSGRFDQADALLFGVPTGIPIVRVRTKSDLPMPEPIAAGFESLAVCALDGSAMGSLRRAIADAVTVRTGSGVGVFVPRHRRALVQAHDGIVSARSRLDASSRIIEEPELVALGMRQSLDALGELVGDISPDDVIGRVFATFCVGK